MNNHVNTAELAPDFYRDTGVVTTRRVFFYHALSCHKSPFSTKNKKSYYESQYSKPKKQNSLSESRRHCLGF